jgi:hypothetical protein
VLNAKVVIGLVALLSCLAISTASAAGASYFPTTKQGALTKYEAKQKANHVFTINSTVVECIKAVFTGTTPPAKGSKTVLVVPSYAECKFAGKSAKVVNTNCAFEFLVPSGTSPNFSGMVSIVAVPGQKLCALVLIVPVAELTCEIKVENVAANMGLSLVKAVNLTGNLGSLINSEVASITFVADTGSGCTSAGIKSGSTAKYFGEVEDSAIFVA